MPRRNSPRSDNLRRAIAQEAARIMAEQGIHDFLTAKRKAAERYGNPDAAVWPRNTEIEAALIEYQRLFAADTHGSRLQGQRSAALAAMRRLTRFAPRLVGPVLSGTATPHADVQLHLFTDQPEIVGLELLDRGVAHEVIERRHRMNAESVRTFPGLRFEVEGETIEATVFPLDGIRQAPVSPVDGRPMRRADTTELEILVAEARAR
jgi:hypothetical protein